MGQALPCVHLVLDDPYGVTSTHKEFFSASWEHICNYVNSHNDRRDLCEPIMRIICPWTGEEFEPRFFREEAAQ
jgi:hypothetical protein